MNKLKGMRCYLSGAISFSNDQGWKDQLKIFLENKGVTVLDPSNKPTEIGKETVESRNWLRKLKEEENWDEISKEVKAVRCVDLRMVDISDFIIVNVDLEIYTIGTWEEVTLANRQKKPILIRIRQGKGGGAWWLFGMVPHQMIFSTFDAIEDYLNKIDSGEILDPFRRWYFFNFGD